jgi:hypothetical protein
VLSAVKRAVELYSWMANSRKNGFVLREDVESNSLVSTISIQINKRRIHNQQVCLRFSYAALYRFLSGR